MPDQEDRRTALLCIFQDGRATLTHLRNASGGRLDQLGINGLYRVGDQEVGLYVAGLDKYLFEIGFAEDEAIRVLMCDTVGTKFQLAAALLA